MDFCVIVKLKKKFWFVVDLYWRLLMEGMIIEQKFDDSSQHIIIFV